MRPFDKLYQAFETDILPEGDEELLDRICQVLDLAGKAGRSGISINSRDKSEIDFYTTLENLGIMKVKFPIKGGKSDWYAVITDEGRDYIKRHCL